MKNKTIDLINHPPHYKHLPNGIECIDVAEHFNFNLGNVLKYVWRTGKKQECPIADLKKAQWYLNREISYLEKSLAMVKGLE